MMSILAMVLLAPPPAAKDPNTVVVGRAGVVVSVDDNYIEVQCGKTLRKWELSTDKLDVRINNGEAELKDVRKGDRVLVIFDAQHRGKKEIVSRVLVRRPWPKE